MIDKKWKRQKDISHNDLKKDFLNTGKEYRPYMFWFWIDDEPKPENYGAQATDMAGKGMSCGYAQDRGFLGSHSELYFKCFDEALKKTKEAGLSMGYCEPARLLMTDGFRGDDPELTEISLKCVPRLVKKGQSTGFDPAFFTVVAKVDENGVIDSSTLCVLDDLFCTVTMFRAKDADYKVFPFYKYTSATVEGCKTNLLTKKAGERLMEFMHDLYINRYNEDLGETLSGHFFDWEGDYGYKLCWSSELEEEYKKRTGRDMKQNMPLLLEKDKQGLWMRARYDWFDAVSEVYTEYIFKLPSDELEKYGMTFYTHLWEERLLGQALLAGDPMRIYRNISLPGIDHLGKDRWNTRSYKEVQSVCEFENKRFACEILSVCGWELKPNELKGSVNNAISLSVDHFVLHGAYSRRDEIRYAPYAPDFYDWAPMWEYFDECTDYITRASYLVSKGEICADVLVYNPMESVWALLGDGAFDAKISYEDLWVYDKPKLEEDFEYGKEITAIDKKYIQAIDELTESRVGFLIADKFYLENMEIIDGQLCYKNKSFKAIVLPPLKILTLENAKKLVEFAKCGGYVYSMGYLPTASAENGDNDKCMIDLMNQLQNQKSFINVNESLNPEVGKGGLLPQLDFAEGGFKIHWQKRIIDGREFYWISNETELIQKCRIVFAGAKGRAYKWNPETGERTPMTSYMSEEGSIIPLEMNISEGFFVEFVREEEPAEIHTDECDYMVICGEWNIKFNPDAQPKNPTGFDLNVPEEMKKGITAELKPWSEYGLSNFSGSIDYEKEFILPKDVSKIEIDLGNVRYMATVAIDGEEQKKLFSPYRYVFENKFSEGKHKIHVRVANTLINLLNPHRMDSGRDFWPPCRPVPEDFVSGLTDHVKVYWSV